MAIDSAAKRRSAGGTAFVPLGPGVSPNSAKDLAWRQSSGWSYGGIAASQPPAPPAGSAFGEGFRRNVGRLLR